MTYMRFVIYLVTGDVGFEKWSGGFRNCKKLLEKMAV